MPMRLALASALGLVHTVMPWPLTQAMWATLRFRDLAPLKINLQYLQRQASLIDLPSAASSAAVTASVCWLTTTSCVRTPGRRISSPEWLVESEDSPVKET